MADNVQMPSDVDSNYTTNIQNSTQSNEHGFCAGLMAIQESVKNVGKSAYEIAVKNGFDGTEQEWLDSLKGKDGQSAADSYMVILSKESYIFLGTSTHAIPNSVSLVVSGYKGHDKVKVTVGSITNLPNGMGVAITNNNTEDVTLTINVDETMTYGSGTLDIPVTIEGSIYTKCFSYAIAFQGATGESGIDGVSVLSIDEYYLVSDKSQGITISDSGWVANTIPTMTEIHCYLWNYKVTTYSNGTSNIIDPNIIGVYGKSGQDGTNGRGIKNIIPYYLASSQGSNITVDTEGWTTDRQTFSQDKPYLWNYQVIIYDDNESINTTPTIIGMYLKGDKGDKGDQGEAGKDGTNGQDGESSYSVVLGNENISIPCTSDGSVDSETIINVPVYSYIGTSMVANAIVVSDLPIGVTSEVTNGTAAKQGNVKLIFSKSSKLGGSNSGVINISVTIVSQSFDKKFTWAKQLAGQTGESGQDARIYFLEPTTTVIKVGKNDVLKPSNVTFSAFYRDGSSIVRTSYGARFIIQESVDGETFTNTYTSSENETSKSYTPSTKAKVVKCDMYASDGTTLLDTQSVVLVSDVDGIVIGGRNLLLETKTWLSGNNGGTIQDDLYKGFKVLYYDNSSGTGTVDVAVWNNIFEVKANTYYTLSFWAKGSGGLSSYITSGSTIASGESNQGSSTAYEDGGIYHALKENWTYYTITWKTLPTASGIKNCIAGRIATGGKVYICGCKLEESNVASDWTPSPDDVDSAIEAVQATADGKNTIYYSIDEPSGGTYKTNDVWFDTDDNNTMYMFNGSSWVKKQFGNTAISNLDASKINTGILNADRIGARSIVSDKLVANTITAESGVIADAAITNAKIKDASITNVKIADLAVTNGKIANATIETAKIKDLAITNAKIADATIETAKIKDLAITTAKINNASITNAKIGDLAVTNAKIADATIESAKIKELDAAKITTGILDAERIGANAITAEKIATDAIKSRNYIEDSTGSFLNLSDGSFLSKNLSWTSEGVLTAKGASIEGNITATSGTFTGTINSTNGTIGGWYIDSNMIYTTQTEVSSQASQMRFVGLQRMSSEPTDIIFGSGILYNPRGDRTFEYNTYLTAEGKFVCGNIEATGGYISGWQINQTNLTSPTKTSGTMQSVSQINPYGFYNERYDSSFDVANLYTIEMNDGSLSFWEKTRKSDGDYVLNQLLIMGRNINNIIYDGTTTIGNEESLVTMQSIIFNDDGGIDISAPDGEITLNGMRFGVNKVLWSGNLYMKADQTANLSESVSSQPHGIVLAWSAYKSGEGSKNYDWYFGFVPKYHINIANGSGCFFINPYVGMIKYVYIHNTKIVGNSRNYGTGKSNGISYDGAKYVLRYVVGV